MGILKKSHYEKGAFARENFCHLLVHTSLRFDGICKNGSKRVFNFLLKAAMHSKLILYSDFWKKNGVFATENYGDSLTFGTTH